MFVCKKINNNLRYRIQILDRRFNDLWLCHFPKKTLSDYFNDMKMTVEFKLASSLNMHQGRQLCCIKRDDLVID